jgi:hypothetical protein
MIDSVDRHVFRRRPAGAVVSHLNLNICRATNPLLPRRGQSQTTRKQAIDLQAAILVALRKRNGGTVTDIGAQARWVLNAGADAGHSI